MVDHRRNISFTTRKNCIYFHFHLFYCRCTLTVHPCSSTTCQLRIEFLDLSLVGPTGDGSCNTDAITITGGASNVPVLCGENSGQHVVVDFDDENPILITVAATSSYTFGRHWFIRATQYNCDSENKGRTLKTYVAYTVPTLRHSIACLLFNNFRFSTLPQRHPDAFSII